MKKQYEIIQAVVLVLLLVLAYFIGNAIIKGIMLLLFSGVLIFNTIMKLKHKDDKLGKKFFYGIMLFLNLMIALGAIFVIITAIIG